MCEIKTLTTLPSLCRATIFTEIQDEDFALNLTLNCVSCRTFTYKMPTGPCEACIAKSSCEISALLGDYTV